MPTTVTATDGSGNTVILDYKPNADGSGYVVQIEAATPAGQVLSITAPDGQEVWRGTTSSGDQG